MDPIMSDMGYCIQISPAPVASADSGPVSAPSDLGNISDTAHYGFNGADADSIESVDVFHDAKFEEVGSDDSVTSDDVGTCYFFGSEGPLATVCGSCGDPSRHYLRFFLNSSAGSQA